MSESFEIRNEPHGGLIYHADIKHPAFKDPLDQKETLNILNAQARVISSQAAEIEQWRTRARYLREVFGPEDWRMECESIAPGEWYQQLDEYMKKYPQDWGLAQEDPPDAPPSD